MGIVMEIARSSILPVDSEKILSYLRHTMVYRMPWIRLYRT